MRRVYMDANATTPVLAEVRGAMRQCLEEGFGNASSIHHFGQQARAAVERAREAVAELLGCRAAEVVFTSGGTESDNTALFGVTRPGDHIITSAIEHEAVLKSAHELERRGCAVSVVSVDGQGRVDPGEIRRALRPETRLISVMMANNETGVLQPVEEISRIAQEAGVLFHTDAVQAAGKVPIATAAIGCDLLSLSAHKMHGPQGIGCLYIKKGTLIQPLLYGGNHERQRRAGTENLPGIVGMGKAAELAQRGFADGSVERIRALRDRLEQGLLAAVEGSGVNGNGAPRVPNTSNLHLDHVEGEALIIALDLKGLAISTGAACSSGAVEPSHVLTAMGLSAARARGSFRFSLGKHSTEADVDFALEVVPPAVAQLRELSPQYRKQTVTGVR
jgi:cysteine desulfurase